MEDRNMARKSSAVQASDETRQSHHRRSSERGASSQNLEQHSETGRTKVACPVIFERTHTGYSAYSPDVPGCVAAARTLPSTRKLIREALEFHLEGMAEDGDELPQPSGHAEDIMVRLPAIPNRKAS